MNQHEHGHGPSGPKRLPLEARRTEKDPVCGMDVPVDAPLRTEFAGKTYVFCGRSCLERFQKDPHAFVGGNPEAAQAKPAVAPPAGQKVQWTCPMHPQIVRDQPGSCPICGMALEPKTITAEAQENPELRDMTRRFWTATALTVPLVVLAM